jgi:hypothetical protein
VRSDGREKQPIHFFLHIELARSPPPQGAIQLHNILQIFLLVVISFHPYNIYKKSNDLKATTYQSKQYGEISLSTNARIAFLWREKGESGGERGELINGREEMRMLILMFETSLTHLKFK